MEGSDSYRQWIKTKKKACTNRPFILVARPSSANAVRKRSIRTHYIPSGQSLLVSESPIKVGFPDPSRPDFPEYGYRFFQTPTFYTNIAGVSPQQYFIPHLKSKVNKIQLNYGNNTKYPKPTFYLFRLSSHFVYSENHRENVDFSGSPQNSKRHVRRFAVLPRRCRLRGERYPPRTDQRCRE